MGSKSDPDQTGSIDGLQGLSGYSENAVRSPELTVNARGRGALTNETSRFEPYEKTGFDDGWLETFDEDDLVKLRTSVTHENAKHIISRNQSPDVPFDRSINAYRGCEHGCIYCFARPSHAYMGLSPGLDFESRLFAKTGAPQLLRDELARKNYKVRPIAMGTNTDPYQPIEKEYQITRRLLEILLECRHPVTIVTKSSLILRDIDILSELARLNLVKVAISVTTLDRKLARLMEPRANTPQRRLDTIRLLSERGIKCGIMAAPIIPALTDHELERIIEAGAHAGATDGSYIMLRLPYEIKDLFSDWLGRHFPDRKDRVLAHIKSVRGGKLNDPNFKSRMRGAGTYATLIKNRFALALRRVGFDSSLEREAYVDMLRTDLFIPPAGKQGQLPLF